MEPNCNSCGEDYRWPSRIANDLEDPIDEVTFWLKSKTDEITFDYTETQRNVKAAKKLEETRIHPFVEKQLENLEKCLDELEDIDDEGISYDPDDEESEGEAQLFDRLPE